MLGLLLNLILLIVHLVAGTFRPLMTVEMLGGRLPAGGIPWLDTRAVQLVNLFGVND